MTRMSNFAQNPLLLLACLLLGAVCGLTAPDVLIVLQPLGELYIKMVEAAALPLLVVAVFFGLRQVIALPNSAVRLFTVFVLTILATFACSALGAFFATLFNSGGALTLDDIAQIGKLVSTLDDHFSMTLAISQDRVISQSSAAEAEWSNFFYALSFGSVFSVMTGALLFGLAFAVQNGTQARTLSHVFETVYRALEWLILKLNIFLPLVAFIVAATATATTGSLWLSIMEEFLLPYFFAILAVVIFVVFVIARHLGLEMMPVLNALSAPMAVVTLSGGAGAMAALPSTIDAMGARLGFNRGLVELVMPTSTVFLKAGDALFIGMLAIFVANLYGRPISMVDFAVVCALSTVAAFMAVGGHGKTLVLSSVVLTALDLPLEAVLPVFLILEIICEGPRNLLSLLIGCVIVAAASRGLHSETTSAETDTIERSYLFVMNRSQIYLVFGVFALVIAITLFAGIGFGIRAVDFKSPVSGIGVGYSEIMHILNFEGLKNG